MDAWVIYSWAALEARRSGEEPGPLRVNCGRGTPLSTSSFDLRLKRRVLPSLPAEATLGIPRHQTHSGCRSKILQRNSPRHGVHWYISRLGGASAGREGFHVVMRDAASRSRRPKRTTRMLQANGLIDAKCVAASSVIPVLHVDLLRT